MELVFVEVLDHIKIKHQDNIKIISRYESRKDQEDLKPADLDVLS
jgi:hypothetical protein